MSYMTIRPIETEEDLAHALGRIDELMDAKVNTPEADELDILSQLVELYQDKNWPIGLPSPAAAIKFLMEQSGLTE
jgi:HTH-type transcriptional regulator/antitoxin HigA